MKGALGSIESAEPEEPCRLFLFVVTAVRLGDDARPGRRTVLVFSRAPHPDDAMDAAAERMAELGWADVQLEGAKELSVNPATEKDEIAQAAMRQALAIGFAHLVY